MAKKLDSQEVLNTQVLISVKGRTKLVSGAVYHNFDEVPLFRGIYIRECEGTDEDGEPKIMGFYFANMDGEEELITNAYAIQKALDTVTDKGMVRDLGIPLEIEFKGKITNAKGKPFNRFDISLLA
jgi:hypothetical protein